MTELTRRGFLTQTSIGIAAGALAAGGAATLPRLLTAQQGAEPVAAGLAAAPQQLIAHVRDLSTGEISVMAGTREVIHRDRELASRLMRAAQNGVAR
jgi:hypothetical protein